MTDQQEETYTKEQVKYFTEEATFKEKVLGMLATIMSDITDIKVSQKDLDARKADKTYVVSVETLVSNLSARVDKNKTNHEILDKAFNTKNSELDGFMKSSRVWATVLVTVFGILWPVFMFVAAHYKWI